MLTFSESLAETNYKLEDQCQADKNNLSLSICIKIAHLSENHFRFYIQLGFFVSSGSGVLLICFFCLFFIPGYQNSCSA